MARLPGQYTIPEAELIKGQHDRARWAKEALDRQSASIAARKAAERAASSYQPSPPYRSASAEHQEGKRNRVRRLLIPWKSERPGYVYTYLDFTGSDSYALKVREVRTKTYMRRLRVWRAWHWNNLGHWWLSEQYGPNCAAFVDGLLQEIREITGYTLGSDNWLLSRIGFGPKRMKKG